MYSHLLVTVAYDKGHDVGPALDIAQRLGAPGARITLLHVMEPTPLFTLDYMPEGWRDDMRSAIKADLDALAETLENGAVVVAEGDAAHEILDLAAGQDVDCIVIASHRPGTQSLMLGSTASKVVTRAQCAVHVARRG